MVVIQPSTGNILAIAQNKAADVDGLIATNGLYPPGSTFKMVTASAAVRAISPIRRRSSPARVRSRSDRG